MNDKKHFIVGIAGGTGSGKTTVAKSIIKEMKDEKVAIIPLDSYYKDRSDLSFEEREKINYDHPDAFDFDLLIKHIEELKDDKAIQRPVYSFTNHTRLKETISVGPAKITIIEGIMVLAWEPLRKMMDVKIFVDTDADVRFIRRLTRDIQERGRSVQSVITQYLEVVRLMHEEFVEPSKRYANLIVPEGGFNKVAVNIITNNLKSVLKALEEYEEFHI